MRKSLLFSCFIDFKSLETELLLKTVPNEKRGKLKRSLNEHEKKLLFFIIKNPTNLRYNVNDPQTNSSNSKHLALLRSKDSNLS